MGRADGRGVLMGCHEPLAGVVGQCTRLAGSGLVRTGACRRACRDASGFAMDGLAGCDVVTGLSQAARNVVGPGEMRCDDLCTAAGVGTLVERVERALR